MPPTGAPTLSAAISFSNPSRRQGSRFIPENPSDRQVSDIDQNTTELCRVPPGLSEIAVRLLTLEFGAENPDVLWESRSFGGWPPKWLERRRIIPTFFETHVVTDLYAMQPLSLSNSRALPLATRSGSSTRIEPCMFIATPVLCSVLDCPGNSMAPPSPQASPPTARISGSSSIASPILCSLMLGRISPFGRHAAISSFAISSSNKDSSDFLTDGAYILVLNNTPSTDKVFKYTVGGR